MWTYLSETPLAQNVKYFVKWLILSAVIGIVTGLIGSAFGHGVIIATKIWEGYTWTVFFMPVAGVLIVWLYQVEHQEKNRGTDLILESISSQEEIPVITAPLIFVSSI